MTVGSGLSINPGETSLPRIVAFARQLAEGRSNAVGTVTLNGNGSATATTVTCPTCGSNSAVFLFPATAHAAAVVATTYAKASDVSPRQFIVTHATTSNSDVTFWFVCLG